MSCRIILNHHHIHHPSTTKERGEEVGDRRDRGGEERDDDVFEEVLRRTPTTSSKTSVLARHKVTARLIGLVTNESRAKVVDVSSVVSQFFFRAREEGEKKEQAKVQTPPPQPETSIKYV